MLTFLRYLFSAGIASVVDLVVAQSLLVVDLFQQGLMFGIPVVFGALAGMSVNFFLSRRYVFSPDSRAASHQAQSFFIVSLSTLVFRLVVAYLLLALFALPLFNWLNLIPIDAVAGRLAQIGAMGFVAIYSFFAHKHISFSGGLRHWISLRLEAK